MLRTFSIVAVARNAGHVLLNALAPIALPVGHVYGCMARRVSSRNAPVRKSAAATQFRLERIRPRQDLLVQFSRTAHVHPLSVQFVPAHVHPGSASTPGHSGRFTFEIGRKLMTWFGFRVGRDCIYKTRIYSYFLAIFQYDLVRIITRVPR